MYARLKSYMELITDFYFVPFLTDEGVIDKKTWLAFLSGVEEK